MCGPALAIVGAAASLAGSMVAAKGQAQQADAQAAQLDYNAKVSRINARSERFAGQAEREAAVPKQDALRGELRAAAAKNNVDPFFGSAAAIFEQNEQNFVQDQNARYVNAEGKAVGHENKARDLEAQAAAVRDSKKTMQTASILSGIGGAVGSLKGAVGGGGGGGGGALFING